LNGTSDASELRFVIVGLGTQGKKRLETLGAASYLSIDPFVPEATYPDVESFPVEAVDAAFICTPEDSKYQIAKYFVSHGKHVVIEKPFELSPAMYEEMLIIQKRTGATIYVAYNHRFEPHIVAMKELLEKNLLGDLYSVNISYGNGTAAQVMQSPWRDQGLGVVADLGSHVLDLIDFWWGLEGRELNFYEADKHENLSFDHARFLISGTPKVFSEVSLISWRNEFLCSITGSEGSAHIRNLCKWGPSELTIRHRKRPSGRPDEESTILVQSDPTFKRELQHFKGLVAEGNLGNMAISAKISDLLESVK